MVLMKSKRSALAILMIAMLMMFVGGSFSMVYAEGNQQTASTTAAVNRLKNSVILLVGSERSFVNMKKTQIDPENTQVKPEIVNGRTLVPVRFISESMGAQVSWDAGQSAVSIKMSDKEIKMILNSNTYEVNGVQKTLDVPVQSVNGRTLIPLRAMAEAIGKQVFWDQSGLIIISDVPDIFNNSTDKPLIELIVKRFSNAVYNEFSIN